MNSPHKGRWPGVGMFYLICAWTNGWQSRRIWFETPSPPLWRHYNEYNHSSRSHPTLGWKSILPFRTCEFTFTCMFRVHDDVIIFMSFILSTMTIFTGSLKLTLCVNLVYTVFIPVQIQPTNTVLNTNHYRFLFSVSVRFACDVLEVKMLHDDVIKWKHFPRYWPFVRRIHRSPVNSPHKGQWRGAFMFSLICFLMNDWVNNGEAGDLRRYLIHYDVTVMRRPIGRHYTWITYCFNHTDFRFKK